MSNGQKDDLSNTKAVISGSMPKVSNGRTWLGHLENRQSGMIDLLILEAIYSVREIAVKIENTYPNVTDSLERVLDHIKHLQIGNARGRASGMKPHNLKITQDVEGKVRFDVN